MPVVIDRPVFYSAREDRPGFPMLGANAEVDAVALDFEERSDGCGGFGQISEAECVRHYTRLSTLNFDIDRGMYPLGSCTMKHNPRLNEAVAADPHFANPHPYWPERHLAAHRQVMSELARDLAEVSGFDEVCLDPAAGAHGELTATFMMRAYHDARGNDQKRVILMPDTAHGTNPASATMSGFRCKNVKSGPDGYLRLEDVAPHIDETTAGIMVTNPNTCGIYEADFKAIAEALHEVDALVYMDGANFNAIMGIFQPGQLGVDVMHFNLHKTFTTPHGGGGPGSGPIGYNEKLVPFAPGSASDQSIGPVKAYLGQWGMFIRAWVYIRSLGGAGLKEVSEESVIAANYLRARFDGKIHRPFDTPTFHEFLVTDRDFPGDLSTGELAKRLIDHGFHPPTVYFPIHVKGALLIEPTETESLEELDRFADALIAVLEEMQSDPETVRSAPHSAPVKRVDEAHGARNLKLRWAPEDE